MRYLYKITSSNSSKHRRREFPNIYRQSPWMLSLLWLIKKSIMQLYRKLHNSKITKLRGKIMWTNRMEISSKMLLDKTYTGHSITLWLQNPSLMTDIKLLKEDHQLETSSTLLITRLKRTSICKTIEVLCFAVTLTITFKSSLSRFLMLMCQLSLNRH